MKALYLILTTFFFSSMNLFAQQFVNGDLEGTVDTVMIIPEGWENVKPQDPACRAMYWYQATPDLTDSLGPWYRYGIKGIAQSGDTFVTGLSGGWDQHHEGIQQKLTGLVIGQVYRIIFYQAVIKQESHIDSSGSWAVYQDDKLLGFSEPSGSQLHYNDTKLKWEKRSVVFEATAEEHMIKFLPEDDDNIFEVNEPDGWLRMGIDNISLEEVVDGKIVHPLEMLIYPNPTLDQFTVQTELENYELIITNPLGQIVYDRLNCSYNHRVELNMNGTFMVMIKTEDQFTTDWVIIQ